MYKGKKTLFYNGEELWGEYDGSVEEVDPFIYDWEERYSWEAIIVLPGVEEIPHRTFRYCVNVKTVVMSDSVEWIGPFAFSVCLRLVFVKLSRNLQYMSAHAFQNCESLPSIFIPPSCGEIEDNAIISCHKLIIFNVPQHTHLGEGVIEDTALIKASPFEVDEDEEFNDHYEVNQWVKNINTGREYSLHRICCSTYENEDLPISESVYETVKEQGPQILQAKNKIGITPLKYLKENPYLENLDEMKLLKRYIAEKMGLD